MKAASMIKIEKLPTKIRRLDQLTKEMGGPQLYIKRDNKSGLPVGEGKERILEIFMADAMNKGAEYIFTSGEFQVDDIRMLSSTAAYFGLKLVVVVTAHANEFPNYNEWFHNTCEVVKYYVPVHHQVTRKELNDIGRKRVKELQQLYEKSGKKTYVIPQTTEDEQITICNMLEIQRQIRKRNLHIQYIVVPFEAAKSFAALIIANALFHTGVIPIGISVSNEAVTNRKQTLEMIRKMTMKWDLDVTIHEKDIQIFNMDGCCCGIHKESGIQAIKLLANKEAIFLDHYHTGKAMAGLFSLIKNGRFTLDEGVLFLHAGELPALFALEG